MQTKPILSTVNDLLQNQDFARAREIIQTALETNPDFFLYYEILGDIHVGEGKPGSARAAYRYALKLRPSATWVADKLARLDGDGVERSFPGRFKRYPDLTDGRKAEGGRRMPGILRKSMPGKPLVTIVTAVYDNENSLQRCIDSIQAQTYDNVEHIIVDGGSPEGTLDILRANEETLDYYVSEPDKGIYSAMNKGIELARGEYICLLNSDDRHEPDFVKRSVEEALAEPEGQRPDIVYSDFFDGGTHLPAQPLNPGIMFGNLNVNHCTFLVHKNCYDRVGPYREDMGIVSDMVWIRKAYTTGERFKLMSEPYFCFYHGGASSGNSPERRAKIIRENGECYRADFPFLTQEEAEALYLMRFTDSKLDTAVDVFRRHAEGNDRFNSALAGYVEHCFRDRGAFDLAYDQEERFVKYWAVADELGIDKRHIRMATSVGNTSEILGGIAEMALKPATPGRRRILHYVTDFSTPSETFIYDLLLRLESETEHDNIVLYQRPRLREERPYDKAIHLPWEKLCKSVSQAIYSYIVETLEIDLLVAHFAINEHRLHSRVAETGITLPTIVMTHGIDVFLLKEQSSYSAYVLNTLAKRPDVCFTAVSDYLRRELVQAGVPDGKITTLPNSVNPRFFEHRKTDRFYDRSRPLEMLCIGRLIAWKGHRFLLEALARFRKDCTKDARLTLVYGNDDTLLEDLKKQAEALGLKDNVTFLPFVDFSTEPDFLSRYDLYVHPSTYTEDASRKSETFGVAVLEAISAGLPVITTDAGGLPEVIGTDSPHARVVEHGSADALYTAMRSMWETPGSFTDNAAYARERLETFSGTGQAERLDALIHSIATPINAALFSSATLQGAGYAAYRVHKGLLALPGIKPTIFTTIRHHQREPGVKFVAHPSGNGNGWRAIQPPPRPGKTIFTVNQTHIPSKTLLEMVEPYDIINLHFHARFLSAENVATLTHSGKPVVMTIRDMQPITGGTHFFHGDTEWQLESTDYDCRQIPSNQTRFPGQVLAAKRKYYNFDNLTLVALSTHSRGILERAPYFRDCRIEVIPNSIETDVFFPYDRYRRREEFGLPKDRKIIGYVPSFSSEVKGYREFMAALEKLDPKELGFDPFIMMVGGETPATAAIKQDKKALGYISDNAKLARAYSCADLIVVPSLEETFSNTAAEAIACGVPVVGFRTGAIPDLAVNGKTGYTAEVGDVDGLAHGIKTVLQAPSMHDACRAHAVEMLSFMKQAHAYEALYRDLLQNRAKPSGPQDPAKIWDCFDELGFGLGNIAIERVLDIPY
ncbi:glycosyltransferase [Salipiger aestuarii]|uniref:glycosyltransferase n=1 Tax=Salipiger aestuarii TaxID=568098 RepID=UPI0016802D1F|nr:glycosyltransferase [Salipiger aestuarii]KAA8610026.1 hypothetical protein AL037_14330 [Salipiger aestuarii]